ncbi:cupin domain-containing protein [Acinetobacter larvae]|uniref:Cupin n=1 Tax=Acinetobacter larvae TaxID=1789224 RepID=A0A1B2LYH6_9GAMM|nr:cupin domain-containing protein [Acinetobacter larvae]AOA58012.1 cupin [Acinetobacter larvae]
MSQPLDILGGISAEQFLSEYWQKKPLLVRAAMPEIVGLLEPEDVKQLALEDHVTARLIQQHAAQQWQVKNAPLQPKDFKKLAAHWTLLVQAVDHFSLDLAALWQKFDFLPQWRRDDIMVSYAPKGGSVGQHFDFYDVFLVQSYGHRRWQLGQMCDEHSAFLADQPIKLLPDMNVYFDEILAPGDLLYVPPGLSHHGVAEDDCLTCSFGFRMPNPANLLDRVSDHFADNNSLKNPFVDLTRRPSQQSGAIEAAEIAFLKAQLIEKIQHSTDFDAVLASLMSEPNFPDHIPEADELTVDDLAQLLNTGFQIQREPASRLLYLPTANPAKFYANGEALYIDAEQAPILQRLADGACLDFDDQFLCPELDCWLDLINDAVLTLLEPQVHPSI